LVKQQTHPQFEFYIMVASFFCCYRPFIWIFLRQTTNSTKQKQKQKTKIKKQKNKKQKTKNKKQKTKTKQTKQTKLTLSLLSFFQEKELCLVFLFRPDYVLNQDPHVI